MTSSAGGAGRAASALLLLVAGACSGVGGAGATTPGAPAVEGEVVVFAAASLSDAFDTIAEGFEAQHPGASVTFNLGASNALATQVADGAPADVLATASERTMTTVADAGLVEGEPTTFIANVLQIAVAPGNPLGIAGLDDLADPGLVLVLAAPEVPAGRYAAEALADAGVEATPSSLETDVRAALARVELGEADAAIVYASDVVAAGDAVEGVAIRDEDNVAAEYPIAVLAGAPNPAGADAFVRWVLGEEAQAALLEAGFTPR